MEDGLDPFSQAGFQLGFPWEDVGVKRAETQVVVGQPTILVSRKEVICLEKKVLVENVWLLVSAMSKFHKAHWAGKMELNYFRRRPHDIP